MKFYCLGLNSKLFKKKKRKRKVNNRKGMFHCLKVTFTKCVSSELFSFSWEAWRRPCKRHRNYTQPSFCVTFPTVSIHLWLASFMSSTKPTWLLEQAGVEQIIMSLLPLSPLAMGVTPEWRWRRGAQAGR